MYKFLILTLCLINIPNVKAKDTCKLHLKSSISIGFMPNSLIQTTIFKDKYIHKEFFLNYCINKNLPSLYLGIAYDNSNKDNETNNYLSYPSKRIAYSGRILILGINYSFWNYRKFSSTIGINYINNFHLRTATYYDPGPYTSIYRENSKHFAGNIIVEYSPLKHLAIGIGMRGTFNSKYDINVINSNRWPAYEENIPLQNMPIIRLKDIDSGLKITYLTIKYTL